MTVIYRNVDKEGFVSMAAASSFELFGAPGTWDDGGLTGGPGVPWKLSGEIGRYNGIAALEICVDEPCLGGAPAVYPSVPFLAAWVDGRNDGAVPEIWTRALTPE